MKVAYVVINRTDLLVVLVESEVLRAGEGDRVIDQLRQHFRSLPIMLVAIEDNGYRAYAHFQTAALLAMLQLEKIQFREIDLTAALPDQELPF